MRWPWRRDRNGTSEIRARAEAKRRAAQKMTPLYEQLAEHVADLSDDELTRRLRRALGGRA